MEYFRRHRQKTALRRCQPVIICGRDVTSSDRNQRSITDDDHIIRPSTKLTGENHCGALHTVVQAISHRVPAFVGTGRSRKQNKKKSMYNERQKKCKRKRIEAKNAGIVSTAGTSQRESQGQRPRIPPPSLTSADLIRKAPLPVLCTFPPPTLKTELLLRSKWIG